MKEHDNLLAKMILLKPVEDYSTEELRTLSNRFIGGADMLRGRLAKISEDGGKISMELYKRKKSLDDYGNYCFWKVDEVMYSKLEHLEMKRDGVE